MTRALFTGDRNWTAEAPVRHVLSRLPTGSVVIHGNNGNLRGTLGLDRMAGRIAAELGFEVIAYPADWRRYGRAAGPIRNARMLHEGQPEIVYAFHDNLSHSRGTRDMVEQAMKAAIPVRVFTSTDNGDER